MSSAAAVSGNQQNSHQRQTAKEIITANVKALIEQLEAGHSWSVGPHCNSIDLAECFVRI